jgi:cation transport ATPase
MNDPETYFVVPPHRLRGVSETIHEYEEHFWRNGHSPQIIVFDDSTPTNVEKYFTHYCGSILVRDRLRPSAAPAIKAVSDMEHQSRSADGGHKSKRAAAEAVADQLGIVQAYSELLPQQKTGFIAEQGFYLRRRSRTTI